MMERVWMKTRKLIASTLEHRWDGQIVTWKLYQFRLSWHTVTATSELRERMGLCEGCLEFTKNRLDMYLQTDL